MAWTEPTAWEPGDPLTADRLNTEVKDNLLALKNPPTAHYEANESSDLSLTSTSWADVDATEGKFQHTIETKGGDLLVGLHLVVGGVTGDRVWLDIEIDNNRIGGNDGIHAIHTHGFGNPIDGHGGFVHLLTGLPADTYVIKLKYKVNVGPIPVYRGAGTSGADIIPQFWVREV